MDWKIQRGKKRKPEQATLRIKWGRLKEDNLIVQFREKVLDKVGPVESVQEWWEETSTTILDESMTGGVGYDNWVEAPWR